jgi:NAD(P)-dependent dehydrogenase (short-subunit alcohol dehydrogenase family)
VRELAGKVAVVTGAASGIGLALARRFAGEGMRIVLADVEEPALDLAVAALQDTGVEVLGAVTDVSDAGQVQALADATVERFGTVHLVCNNAGVGAGGLSWEAPLSTWEWVLGVNLWGVVHGIRSFVPLLVEQGEGHVVNTASVAGLVAPPYMGPYSASKHAVVAISETLLHELRFVGANVGVSVVCPGWVRTRIAESDRNRPTPLDVADGETDAAVRAVLERAIEGGMAPERVADQVLDAVLEDRFWVLTHDRADLWVKAVDARLESVAARRNPTPVLPV